MLLNAGSLGASPNKPSDNDLKTLYEALQNSGISTADVDKITHDSRFKEHFEKRYERQHRIISLNGINQEKASIYSQFTGKYAITKARRFIQKNRQLLEDIQRRYGVPYDVLTAILLVETQFGTVRLPFNVFGVYFTLVINGSTANIKKNYARLKRRIPDLDFAYFANRMKKRSLWAANELASLIKMGKMNDVDIFSISGSYAGALGIPQFIPSSYLNWAVDGDGDGKVNLNNLEDALASTANYLREHGWRNKASLDDKSRAIWQYNNSQHYVDAIFGIRLRLGLPATKNVQQRPQT